MFLPMTHPNINRGSKNLANGCEEFMDIWICFVEIGQKMAYRKAAAKLFDIALNNIVLETVEVRNPFIDYSFRFYLIAG